GTFAMAPSHGLRPAEEPGTYAAVGLSDVHGRRELAGNYEGLQGSEGRNHFPHHEAGRNVAGRLAGMDRRTGYRESISVSCGVKGGRDAGCLEPSARCSRLTSLTSPCNPGRNRRKPVGGTHAAA